MYEVYSFMRDWPAEYQFILVFVIVVMCLFKNKL